MKNKKIISIVLVMLFAVSMFSTMTFAEGEITVDASISSSSISVEGTSDSPKVVVRVYYDENKDGAVSADGAIDPIFAWLDAEITPAETGYTYACDAIGIDSASEKGDYIVYVTDEHGHEAMDTVSYSGTTVNNNGGGDGTKPSPSPSTAPTPTPTPGTSVDNYPFVDVTAAHDWARGAIRVLAERGVVNGVADKIFAPDDTVTRAQFAKMIVGFFGDADTAGIAFNDVDASAWYYPYVMKAAAHGITIGDDMGNFNPDANITREDMCVMLERAGKKLGLVVPEVSPFFADSDQISDYAKAAVAGLAQLGIVNGVGDNMFAPKANATRAEAAKVVYQVFAVNLKL